MGLIAEWNRQDLTQLVNASVPQFTNGAGSPTMSVVNVSERGNVLRYNGDGVDVEHCFMFTAASGLIMASTTERRDIDVEIEIHEEANTPANWGMGIFFMGDGDSPSHGFAHLGMGDQERQRLLNNGVVEAVTGGTATSRFLRYQIRGRKPAGAPPEVSSYVRGWNTTSGSLGEPRRSGSSSVARGAVTAFGTGSSVLGSTWDSISADRLGLWFMTAGGGAAPDIDILNVRIVDPFAEGAPTITYHQRIFDTGVGNYVYYSKTTVDAAPLSGETTPNHTNNLVASTHEIL